MAGHADRDSEHESRRILDRIARETEPGGLPSDRHGHDHSDFDPIEYWGTRIGRVLGLVLTIAIVIAAGYYIARHL
ncbi:hypothetical protein CYK37_23410 [Mesorhizobium loti]|nr:hypothetical protein [Mesorhizobium loti]PLP56763.1 hypothetical protein CYK37_23410 [Mesorhizobium loti]